MSSVRHKLLSVEREGVILRLLDKGFTGIAELSERVGVSEATVRRDLLTLKSAGKVRRVHGGALKLGGLDPEPVFLEKAARNAAEKERIANLALSLVEDSDTLYLDGGSTVQYLAKLLGFRKNLLIVTNSLMAATELYDTEHRIILVGGEFRKLSRTLVGALTGKFLERMHFDKAFLGTIGITGAGISTTDPNEAFTKELVMGRAQKVFVLADSSKVGIESFALSGRLNDIDVLITDKQVPAEFADDLRDGGVEVIC